MWVAQRAFRTPLHPSGPTGFPHVIFKLQIRFRKHHVTQQKMRVTQAHPCYSAKNNNAIRMIASFMRLPFTLLTFIFILQSEWFNYLN